MWSYILETKRFFTFQQDVISDSFSKRWEDYRKRVWEEQENRLGITHPGKATNEDDEWNVGVERRR